MKRLIAAAALFAFAAASSSAVTEVAPDTLARREIVTLNIRRIDLLATKHLGDDVARTEDDASADLDHASLLAPFIYLRIDLLYLST